MENRRYYYRVRVFRDEESDKEIAGTRYNIEETGNARTMLTEEARTKIIQTALEGFVKKIIPNPSKTTFELEQYVEIRE